MSYQLKLQQKDVAVQKKVRCTEITAHQRNLQIQIAYYILNDEHKNILRLLSQIIGKSILTP